MLDIVEFLAEQRRPWGINELSRELGITTNSVFRILRRLADRGYAETVGENGGYQLGTRFFSLGMRLHARFELRNRARPYLEALAHKTGETCQLHVLNDRGMLVLDVASPPADWFLQMVPGSHLNCYANAFGKAVLAFLPERDVRQHVPRKMEALTENTITTMKALRAELVEIRKTGLAYDREEYTRGIYCIGAPVFDVNEQVVAGVGMTGMTARRSARRMRKSERAVLACAERIAVDIGYTGERYKEWRAGL